MSEQQKRADATGKVVGVIVFLLVAFLVIYLGIQFDWGGWAAIWALVVGGIAAAVASNRSEAWVA